MESKEEGGDYHEQGEWVTNVMQGKYMVNSMI